METLTELYAAHSGKVSDKWQLYLRVYEELFSGRRADACRLLEIGIQNGGSLALWAKYFPNAKHIVGCDIDPACKALVYDDARIRIVAADANSPEAMKQIDSISDAFDIVIDDGSHVPRDVIASFLNYFPRLSPGGLYVAEDLHCDYFASHDGGILEPYTATNFFGCLVKLMSRTYWRDQLPPKDFAKLFFGGGSLPRFVKEDWIDSITFLDSLVVVRRAMIPGGSRLGHRVIVGDAAIVCADVLRIRQNLGRKASDAIDRAQEMHDPLIEPDGLAVLNAAFKAWQRGDAATAESQCRKAIALGQDDARTWTLLGSALRERDPAGAEAALRRAVELDPRFPDAHFQTGNLHRLRGAFDAAIESYRHALALAPSNTHVMNNLALALDGRGDREAAIEVWRDALRHAPGHRQSEANLAHALARAGRHREASAICAEHLRRFPDAEASMWAQQGICLYRLGDHPGSNSCFERSLALAPDDTSILVNIASTLSEARDFAGAEAIFSRVVSRKPRNLYASTMLAHCRQHLCMWTGLPALHEAILGEIDRRKAANALANPFATLAMPMPAETQLRIARKWTQSQIKAEPAAAIVLYRKPAPGARLRIGYVSSDFRTHPVASLLVEVWERHDRARVETFAYSIGPPESTPLRRRIEAAFDHFCDCADEPARKTAERIRSDGIDVLIDLNGHTTLCRPQIFALRPARVQIQWLGFLGSMGADFIDYVLTDRIATPPDAQVNFTERFLYLENCYCPSDTRREVSPGTQGRGASGLPPEGFVFCCFNNVYKILPNVFDVWMRLLHAIPESVLWLTSGNPAVCANLRLEAAHRGIEGPRLVFAPAVPLPEHLARHALANLFLDTTPYNAGTTANDAMLMGLPVLTTLGATMASRVAASQLTAIGLPELVATDLAAYEDTALRLAGHPDELAALRARLAANRSTHPLFDMTRFTLHLEELLTRVAAA